MSKRTSWQSMLSRPVAGQHIVQVYRHDDQLTETVSHFIAEGLRNREAVGVVATAQQWALLVGRLVMHKGFDLVDMVMRGQLRIVDADLMLSTLMDNGVPQWHRFHDKCSDFLRHSNRQHASVRIYAGMSDMLWQERQEDAVGCMGDYWNELAKEHRFSLLRAYKVDGVDTHLYYRALASARKACTHLLPRHDGRPHPLTLPPGMHGEPDSKTAIA